MAVFENPSNGYRETVGFGSVVLAALFGAFYLAWRRLWGYALLWLFGVPLVTVLALSVMGHLLNAISVLTLGLIDQQMAVVLATMAVLAPHLLFSMAVPAMLRQKYLRAGWRMVERP